MTATPPPSTDSVAKIADEMCDACTELQELSADDLAGWAERLRALPAPGAQADAELVKALEQILAISSDRARFVAQGPRGFAQAEQIARAALDAARAQEAKR